MKLCIHKSALGTSRHFVFDGSEFELVGSIPCDAWVYGLQGQHIKSVEPIFEILGEKILFPIDSRYRKPWEISKLSKQVNWSRALPNTVFKSQLQKLVDQLWIILSSFGGTYYLNEFYVIRKLLFGLSRAKIDSNKLKKLQTNCKSASISSSLQKFSPNAEGFSSVPVYSQTSTISGRLTVDKGPNILTLKKEYRSIIKSRYENGKIISVDFSSLEPRVLIEHNGTSCKDDIYSFISESVFNSTLSRDISKKLTLGVLYGLGTTKFSEVITDASIEEIQGYTNKIRDFFKIKSLERSLSSNMSDGMIENIFGRKVPVKGDPMYIVVNRFIQSSAADAALLSFSYLCDQIEDRNLDALPIFLIHDAVIFDVHPESIDRFNQIVSDRLWVPKFNKKFPISCEILSTNF